MSPAISDLVGKRVVVLTEHRAFGSIGNRFLKHIDGEHLVLADKNGAELHRIPTTAVINIGEMPNNMAGRST